MSKFQIGDIVLPQGTTQLRSGCGCYPRAIVVLADPLILVSDCGDMKWSCDNDTKDLVKVGTVSKSSLRKLQRRLYDGLPKWVNHRFIVAILKNYYGASAAQYFLPAMIRFHGRKILGRTPTPKERVAILEFFRSEQPFGVPESEISAPFQHSWGRRQHWLNAVLRNLKLPQIPVKIPKSYERRWPGTLEVRDNKVESVRVWSSPAGYQRGKLDVEAARQQAIDTGLPVITAQQVPK